MELIKTVKIVSASDPDFEQLRQEGKLICGADVELQMQKIKALYYARKNPKEKLQQNHGILNRDTPLEAFEKEKLLKALTYLDEHFSKETKADAKRRVFEHPMGIYPDIWLLQSHTIDQWHERISDTQQRIFEFHPRAKKIKRRIQQYHDHLPKLRLVFSQVVDDQGDYFYRFMGLYGVNLSVSDKEWGVVWQQVYTHFCFDFMS